jgi:hypothetical protein
MVGLFRGRPQAIGVCVAAASNLTDVHSGTATTRYHYHHYHYYHYHYYYYYYYYYLLPTTTFFYHYVLVQDSVLVLACVKASSSIYFI